jgi:hypothetical protein
MTDSNDAYRSRLIASARREQFRQQAREMSREELNNAICDSLGLPRGTELTSEQLKILIESYEMRQLERLRKEESLTP